MNRPQPQTAPAPRIERGAPVPEAPSRLRMDLARRKLKKVSRQYQRAVKLYGNKAATDVIG